MKGKDERRGKILILYRKTYTIRFFFLTFSYMAAKLEDFIRYIETLNWVGDKWIVIEKARLKFAFVKDRSIYYTDDFSVRFCYSASWSFSNTVLSLSNLQKYDQKPFLICLVTKGKNIFYLANSTLLGKISHSSQQLRVDNIKGSFNWSDILKEFAWVNNSPENFPFLFATHKEIPFEENLTRLVEMTNNIAPSWIKFKVSKKNILLKAPERANDFVKSEFFYELKKHLDEQVNKYKSEILIAGFIENTNIRGRIIEYLIAWEDDKLRKNIVDALHRKERNIPGVKTQNELWDYVRIFEKYKTATDIKTKIMILQSNPKAYNIDKMLSFLSEEWSILMFYFIWIEPTKIVAQSLVSIFQKDLQGSTIIQKHWSWRNSRWVAQFNWEIIHKLIINQDNTINLSESIKFITELEQI